MFYLISYTIVCLYLFIFTFYLFIYLLFYVDYEPCSTISINHLRHPSLDLNTFYCRKEYRIYVYTEVRHETMAKGFGYNFLQHWLNPLPGGLLAQGGQISFMLCNKRETIQLNVNICLWYGQGSNQGPLVLEMMH